MFKSLALAGVLLVASAVPALAQVDPKSLLGTYAITGTNQDGSKYEAGSTVTVTMDVSGGLAVKYDGIIGIGMVQGNTLAIAAVVEKLNTITMMTINGDGTLKGTWYQRTQKGMGTEEWKKK